MFYLIIDFKVLQILMDFHKTKLANELYDLGNIYLPFYFHQKGSETTGI